MFFSLDVKITLVKALVVYEIQSYEYVFISQNGDFADSCISSHSACRGIFGIKSILFLFTTNL